MTLALILFQSAALLMVGVCLIRSGVEARKRSKQQQEWVEEMRRKFPWLRAEP